MGTAQLPCAPPSRQPPCSPWWHGLPRTARPLPFCKPLCCSLLLLPSRGLSPVLTPAASCGTPSWEQGLGETHGSEVGCPLQPVTQLGAGTARLHAPPSPSCSKRGSISVSFSPFHIPARHLTRSRNKNPPAASPTWGLSAEPVRPCRKETTQGHGAARQTPAAPRGCSGVRSRCVSPALVPADVAALPPPCRGLPPRPAPGCD